MIVFNCTKSAADFFTSKKNGQKTSIVESPTHKAIDESISSSIIPEQDVWHWLLHVKKVNRKNILVVMDYRTRFAICLTGVMKGNNAQFMEMFEHHLFMHIKLLMDSMHARADMVDNSIDRYTNNHQQIRFCKRGDRSTQSHINDAIWHFEIDVDHRRGSVPSGVELIGVDDRINSILKKVGGQQDYFEPKDELLKHWLQLYAMVPTRFFPQLFNTLNKRKGYVFDNNLAELTLADISATNPLKKSKKNNVIDFARYNNSKIK